MGSTDIEKLRNFIGCNNFKSYRLRSEDQAGFNGADLLKVDLVFGELLISEFPTSIFLRDGRSMVMIDRPVRISCKANDFSGEITIENRPFCFNGQGRRVYKIVAEKISA